MMALKIMKWNCKADANLKEEYLSTERSKACLGVPQSQVFLSTQQTGFKSVCVVTAAFPALKLSYLSQHDLKNWESSKSKQQQPTRHPTPPVA